MSKTQSGWRGPAGLTLLAAGVSAALFNVSSAQDREMCRGDNRPAVRLGHHWGDYTTGYSSVYQGGPYKGFYPCNGKTPYYGGACNVYGDAPIYSAPADYGHHCAAWCP